jgi:hypothetical protein
VPINPAVPASTNSPWRRRTPLGVDELSLEPIARERPDDAGDGGCREIDVRWRPDSDEQHGEDGRLCERAEHRGGPFHRPELRRQHK